MGAEHNPLPSKKIKDLSGLRFGRLAVTIFVGTKRTGPQSVVSRWLCRCDCGSDVEVSGSQLTCGKTRSCGCLSRELVAARSTTHGRARSRTYKTWQGMLNRCTNPSYTGYKNYGGRGIKVCPRWDSFENFLFDMGDQPDDKTIERDDNDGDYTPENCRWATMKEQAQNRRTTIIIEFNGEKRSVKGWAEHLGIPTSTLRSRLKTMSVEEAFSASRERAHGRIHAHIMSLAA